MLSGGGLHVYWCLTEALRPEEWKPLAEGMKALALNNGLAIDPTVTGDVSRILRPVETHNYKDGTPRPVKLPLKVIVLTSDKSKRNFPLFFKDFSIASKLPSNFSIITSSINLTSFLAAFFCVPFTLCFMISLTITYLIKKLYYDTKNYLESIHY